MSRDRNLITGTFPATQCRGAHGRPAGVASAGLGQGGLLPPYFALGRSYDGKFAHGRTARSFTIEITVDL
jgi:hypothetical protein